MPQATLTILPPSSRFPTRLGSILLLDCPYRFSTLIVPQLFLNSSFLYPSPSSINILSLHLTFLPPYSFPLDIAKHPRSEAEWDRGTNTRCWESFPIPFLLVFYGILPPLPRGSTILPGTGIERP